MSCANIFIPVRTQTNIRDRRKKKKEKTVFEFNPTFQQQQKNKKGKGAKAKEKEEKEKIASFGFATSPLIRVSSKGKARQQGEPYSLSREHNISNRGKPRQSKPW